MPSLGAAVRYIKACDNCAQLDQSCSDRCHPSHKLCSVRDVLSSYSLARRKDWRHAMDLTQDSPEAAW